KFSPRPGGRLSISGVPVCYPKRGLYRWEVANHRLTLTKLKDTCAAEVGLFAGVWRRGEVAAPVSGATSGARDDQPAPRADQISRSRIRTSVRSWPRLTSSRRVARSAVRLRSRSRL